MGSYTRRNEVPRTTIGLYVCKPPHTFEELWDNQCVCIHSGTTGTEAGEQELLCRCSFQEQDSFCNTKASAYYVSAWASSEKTEFFGVFRLSARSRASRREPICAYFTVLLGATTLPAGAT